MLTGSAPFEPKPTGLETALKHERRIIGAGLVAITLMAWTCTVYLAVAGMGDMHMAMAEPRIRAWSALDLFLMFVMWAVMMVAMMVPSASPMVLLFATVHRQRRQQGKAYVPVSVFATGYVVVWSAFSAAATAAQWGLQQATLLSPMMMVSVPWLGATLHYGRFVSIHALERRLPGEMS